MSKIEKPAASTASMSILYGTKNMKETLSHEQILCSFFNRFATEWVEKRMSIDPTKIAMYHKIIDHLVFNRTPTHWYWLLKCFLYCYRNEMESAVAAAEKAYVLSPCDPSVLWVRSVLLLSRRNQLPYVDYVKHHCNYEQWASMVSQRV